MKKLLPLITQEKRKGVGKLLVWCIKKYQNTQSPIGRRLWYEKKEFLAELQRKQSYDRTDRDEYNRIRQLYIKDKNVQ